VGILYTDIAPVQVSGPRGVVSGALRKPIHLQIKESHSSRGIFRNKELHFTFFFKELNTEKIFGGTVIGGWPQKTLVKKISGPCVSQKKVLDRDTDCTEVAKFY
jgi:hypothetical protein